MEESGRKNLFDMQHTGRANEDELLESLVEDVRGRDPLEDQAANAAHKRDKDGWTPLHWAAQDGHERLAAKLLEMQVTVGAQDNCGATPLMVAAFNNRRGVVEVLLEDRLIDVHQTNQYLSSAVHYAAKRGNAEIIGMLIKARAEVDGHQGKGDKHGDTPLSYAARLGHTDAVRKLLECRADPLTDNYASEDSIELARERGHWDAVELMEAVCDPEDLANST